MVGSHTASQSYGGGGKGRGGEGGGGVMEDMLDALLIPEKKQRHFSKFYQLSKTFISQTRFQIKKLPL